jgi:hypothetical protein
MHEIQTGANVIILKIFSQQKFEKISILCSKFCKFMQNIDHNIGSEEKCILPRRTLPK